MNEEVIPYVCDGMESRKRQKEALQAMRARLDEKEREEKARLADEAEARRTGIKAQEQRRHRKAA